MNRGAGQNAGRAARDAGRAQVQAARDAARQSFQAQQQADRLSAQSARQTSQQRSQAARDAARAQVQAARDAARQIVRVQEQAQRQATQAARDAARTQTQVQRDALRQQTQAQREAARQAQRQADQTSRAQQRASEQAARAAQQGARATQRANDQAAREAQRQAQATARAQQRASDQAARAAQRAANASARAAQRAADQTARAAQRAADAQARAAQRAADAAIRQIERERRARERARQEQVRAGRAAASQLADRGSQNATRGGLLLAGGLALATREAIKWESAFTGVTKTVNATQSQLQGLSAELRNMALQIPVNADELAHIAESAGQLGIQTKEIAKFTRVIADLGVATNLTSEQGSADLARFANITKMSQKDFERLGSTIVDLGNKSATDERRIVAMAMRIAAAGSQIGLTQPKIVAFATALSALGLEAEAGGTAISTIFKKIDTAVRGGGKSLEGFAKVAGLSGEAFKKLYQSDSAAAIEKFAAGLEKIKAKGGDLFGTYSKLELSGIRVQDTLGRLAGNSHKLTEALQIADTAWKENTALTVEAEKRYKTSAAQIEISQNNLREFGIIVGTTIVPALVDLLNSVKPAFEWFRALSKEQQSSYVRMAAYAGGALLVAGRIKGIVDTVILMRTALIGARAAMTGLSAFGVAGFGALAIAATALVAIVWGIRTAIIGTQDAGSMSAEKLKEKWGALGTLWDTMSTKLNGISTWLDKISRNPAIDKILQVVTGGLSGVLRNNFSTYNPEGDAAAKKSALIQANAAKGIKAPKSDVWKIAHGIAIDGARAAGGPVGAKKTYLVGERGPELFVPDANGVVIPANETQRLRGQRAQLQSGIDRLDSKIDSRAVALAQAGDNHRDGQLKIWRAERTQMARELALLKRESVEADRQQRARTKAQRADLRAAAGEYKAVAKEVGDATETALDKLNHLRDGFKGLLQGAQAEMVGMGDVGNSIGRNVKSWERFLKLAESGRDIVASANALAQQQQPASVEQGGGAAPTVSGGSKADARALFEKYNLQSTVDMTCADVASKTVAGLGIAIKKSVNAGELERNVKAAGWRRVDPREAPMGALVFKYSKSARSKTHAMMGLGDGQLASSSNHRVSYFKASGSERAYAPPAAPQAVASVGLGGSYPQLGGGGYTPRVFTAGDYSLSGYKPLGAGWGTGLRANEDNKNRFALQGQLASGALEPEIALVSQRLKDGAATAKFLAETGFTLKAELPLRERAISLLRQQANAQDLATNARRKANEAADRAKETLTELEKARHAIGTEKNPLAGLLAEFEDGGKLAAANSAKAKLLDGQIQLSIAQTAQATREAAEAERVRSSTLKEVAPLLTQAGLASGDYDRALEKVNRRFETWKSPDLAGLLEAAKSYDVLANAALKAANAVALKKGALTAQERTDYNKLKAQAQGYKGRVAGVRREASAAATSRLGAGEMTGNDALAREQISKFFQQKEADMVSLGQRSAEAFKTLKGALADSSRGAADLLEVLSGIDPLLADLPGISEKVAAVSAEAARRAKAEFSSLTDEARLANAQAALVLQYNPDSPALQREMALLEERNRLTLEYNKLTLKGRNGFDLDGKINAFAEVFDAQRGLQNAKDYKALMSEATQATAMFGDTSATAGIKWRTTFGDLSGWSDAWKKDAIEATASIAQISAAADALDSAKNQRIDLQKQMVQELATWYKGSSLSASQQQEIDWKFEDARYKEANPDKPRTESQTAAINAERNAIRGLMRDMDEMTSKRDRAQKIAEGVSGAFMTGFDAVLTRQKSFASAFLDSLQSMLVDAAKQVIQSQLQNALLGLLGGGVAKASGVVPISGASQVGPRKIDGSFATGLDYVPHDNFVGNLHQGEAVLNRQAATNWRKQQERDGAMALGSSRRGGSSETGSVGGDTYININGPMTVKNDKPAQFFDDVRAALPKRELRRRGRSALGI